MTVFATLVAGAFVAGLKAGHVYPTFPKMGGFWAPPGMFEASPWWRNFFENPVTAQFAHRALALASCLLVVAAWGACLGAGASRRVRLWANASLAAAAVQMVLGIFTVLLHVPVPLAAGHQAGAIYEATLSTLLDVLGACAPDAPRTMIVGHNPGLEYLLDHLAGGVPIPGDGKLLPTAALARFDLPDRLAPARTRPGKTRRPYPSARSRRLSTARG